MSNKSRLNWSAEEDQLLKFLRDEEKVEKWNEVATLINSISEHPKTSKQCRQRYISSAKFCRDEVKEKNWTSAQESLIFKLYMEHGPKWTYFSSYFSSRSQNSIKNRFYNFIRKLLRKMNDLNECRYPYNKKSLKIQSLLVILELSKKIQNESEALLGEKVAAEMELLEIRNQILEYSMQARTGCDFDLLNLVDRIHKTNCYLRHLGIFKTKNKKNWKLDKKRLLYIIAMQENPQLSPMEKIEEEQACLTKNHQMLYTAIETSPVKQEVCLLELVEEDCSLPRSPLKQESWSDDFNRQMFDLVGQEILPGFDYDFYL